MPADGIKAANNNLPLWQRVTLRVALDHAELAQLSEVERHALMEKAVSVMKPTGEEQQLLSKDATAQDAYMLTFVKAYRAGMPPLAQLTEAMHKPASDKK